MIVLVVINSFSLVGTIQLLADLINNVLYAICLCANFAFWFKPNRSTSHNSVNYTVGTSFMIWGNPITTSM